MGKPNDDPNRPSRKNTAMPPVGKAFLNQEGNFAATRRQPRFLSRGLSLGESRDWAWGDEQPLNNFS